MAITNKLDQLPGDKTKREKAIDYWKKRLDEDLQEIQAGGEACNDPKA